MKHARTLALLPALVLGLAVHSIALAYPWLGTITSPDGGAFNNTTSTYTLADAGTASRAFTIGHGLRLIVQCDNPVCVQSSGDAGFVATCAPGSSSKGIALQTGQAFPVPLDSSSNVVAMVPVSSTATNCDVFQLPTSP